MVNLEILMTSVVVESDTGFELTTQWIDGVPIHHQVHWSEQSNTEQSLANSEVSSCSQAPFKLQFQCCVECHELGHVRPVKCNIKLRGDCCHLVCCRWWCWRLLQCCLQIHHRFSPSSALMHGQQNGSCSPAPSGSASEREKGPELMDKFLMFSPGSMDRNRPSTLTSIYV